MILVTFVILEITTNSNSDILTVLMKDRLNAIIEEKGLTATRFAALIDANPSAISHLLKGRNKPGYDLLVNIARAFPDISMYWLLTGEGEMYNGIRSTENKKTVIEETFSSKLKESGEPQQTYKASAPKFPVLEIPDVIPPVAAQKELKRIILFFTDGSFEDYNK